MTREVAFVGDQVIKSLGTDADVARLLQRTEALRRAGVATPAARAGGGSGEVAFPRITGSSGLAAVLADGDVALHQIVAVLHPLHTAVVPDLPIFDPLLRIRPRLETANEAWIGAWIASYLPPPSRDGVVHGDFHAGQVIRDADGQIWVLDLDDLALGPCEADLGNFAAHLATRPETRSPDFLAGYHHWLDRVLGACPGTDRDLADRYGRIALLRRGLKLSERGDASVLSELRTI